MTIMDGDRVVREEVDWEKGFPRVDAYWCGITPDFHELGEVLEGEYKGNPVRYLVIESRRKEGGKSLRQLVPEDQEWKGPKRNVAYFNPDGKQICGGRRLDWGQCQVEPVRGSLRCAKHTPKKDRIDKKDLIQVDGVWTSRYKAAHRLQERMEKSLQDPDFMSMRPELAMIDAMLADRWENLEKGGNDDLWEMMTKVYGQLKAAMAGGDVRKTRSVLVEMEAILNAGANEAAARKEIRDLIKDRQRMAEGMQKMVISMKQTVTIEQALMLVNSVLKVVEETVSDSHDRANALYKIAELTQIDDPVVVAGVKSRNRDVIEAQYEVVE
jgi:hypothetical protein